MSRGAINYQRISGLLYELFGYGNGEKVDDQTAEYERTQKNIELFTFFITFYSVSLSAVDGSSGEIKTVGRDGSVRPPVKPRQYHAMTYKWDLTKYQVCFLQIIAHMILLPES